jgi:hypothetical protein
MSPFIEQLARDVLFCAICIGCLWFVTRHREAWLRFVERDLARQRRFHFPASFIHMTCRFCIGKGVVIFLWVMVVVSLVLMLFSVWPHIHAAQTVKLNGSIYEPEVGLLIVGH